jgi:PPOX class probable F420-dependent enzyme
MELTTALAFVRERRTGVLTTIRRDGRPQLSNIVYAVDDTGTIRISVTADRAKTRNLARDPRAALHVSRDDFWAYVVIDAAAELAPVAAAPDDPTVDELVELYRSLSGEHPDWDDYRAAMVRDRRLVVRLTPTGAYGMLPD